MKTFLLLLLSGCLSLQSFAKITIIEDPTNVAFRYEDRTYKKNIKTVQLYQKTWELSPAVIKLNSEQQLKLSFDDLDADLKTYNYTIIHCSANWEPSDIVPFEYINGYTEDYIPNYKYSVNTIQKYNHYNLIFPNDNFKITKSGNYVLKVYLNNDPENFVLSKRFMVYDDKVSLNINVKEATTISDRNYKQEIDFNIDHSGYEIPNPYGDLKVTITQNDRWDNAISTLKPLFIKDNQLVYDYDQDNVFPGGSEYRNFDIKSLRFQTEHIKKIIYDSLKNHVYLTNDEKRSYKQYFSEKDIDGKYLVKIQEGTNSEVEADYAFVHFFIACDSPLPQGNLYVFGSLSDWKCEEANKLKYNQERFGYEGQIYLKQGYYNYEYGFVKDKSESIDNTLVEGMHYETENSYTVYVYYKSLGTNYDQLIAMQKASSVKY